MRTALKGALATLDHATGHPYASLILLATEPGGAPTFLISRLALHTRNLEKDSRASVLIHDTGGLGDPLTGGRLTLTGVARHTARAAAMDDDSPLHVLSSINAALRRTVTDNDLRFCTAAIGVLEPGAVA